MKKEHLIKWGASLFIIWFLISAYSAAKKKQIEDVPHSVVYSVTGATSFANITYDAGQGSSQQEKIRVPWEKTMQMKSGDFLYISAQNEESAGWVEVDIAIDGAIFRHAKSNGGYTIASASGRCCAD